MENNMQGVRGYKVFNPNWTCKGYQYEVGKTFKEDVTPKCCHAGFHFCLEAADCFRYYDFDPDNKVAEVIALGSVDYEKNNTKACTDEIKIIREIPWEEVLRIVNTGKGCTGLRNTGSCNTGDYNTGNCNTGNCNAGSHNTGNRNTGSWNTGDYNTGDWNKSSFNTGCFMTEKPKISLFNKPSDWSYEDWWNSEARRLLNQMSKSAVKWIYENDMTEEEKAENPTYETTGGYLKEFDESECEQIWWDELSENDKQIIKDLPNFDAGIFEQCTGIKINGAEQLESEELR